ncbi:hypothetical protein P3W45_001358 [Vairimorpha bombi]
MTDYSNIEDLFNTIPISKLSTESIVGIKNKLLGTSSLNIEPRYDRVLNRYIDTKPFKILDAPGMVDDYYLNLLDWSSSDIISIGLSNAVYSFNYQKGSVSEIFESSELVTSLKSNNNVLSIGLNDGKIVYYDLEMDKVSMYRRFHDTRIGSQSWNQNILCTGDKTGKIVVQDIRTNEHEVILGHTQEICGLEWSTDHKYLATWCPWKSGVLASGGGTKDKCIKFWDIYEGKKINETQVNSQVCTLKYINKYKELISTHGYVENNIILWKASTMKEVISFGKHDNRVLHSALSPDNTILASVGGDENLKFWKISDKSKKTVKRASLGVR